MTLLTRRAGAGLAAVAVWAGLLGGAAGCTQDGKSPVEIQLPGRVRSPDEAIRITPADNAKGVPADGRLTVTVPEGRLERVKVTKVEDAQQEEVPGAIAADGLSWSPTPQAGRLALAAKYTVDAVALDGHNRRQARRTTFTTYVPEERFIGYFKPEHRSTVGTGMIVSFKFSRAIEQRAEVERAIRVTSDPAVEVVGHWFGKERLDFRPKQYWKPGTKVTVQMALRDVEGAPGSYGIQSKTITFTVGRSQISTVDAAAHTMEVRRDGELLSTVPISAGAPKTTTYNGKMVVMELFDVTRMNGQTVGFGGEYDIPDVPHAMRLTNSGTFLHGNYWSSPDTFGSTNVSHGCVGLRDDKGGGSDTPAGWFFDRTLIGDVVEVVNSQDKTVAADNGLGGWNMSWADWVAGSAVA
ncbi:Ig-like domain-containing protein [Streptomyces erythrochromogenes]|uniref:Ig-like domain-containing protein n=1 Tax=Streptomyces erythrochromogenes TaxID=285574 RepID=A0ABZ1Q9X5_9ACTN|nr:Ig-like domain-containing protein [Streptomyces erythrochromogenes]MCX5584391.1 Ig-like domain-containing protein [Streptomyces erythrochromogenes]